MRRPIVGVMGSGSAGHADLAEPLGRFLAGAGCHLLTGGGEGVMASVSRAFHDVSPRPGLVLGVLPCRDRDPLCRPKSGYPNLWVEVPIRTHLPLSGADGLNARSRNHVNVLTADIVIALPGGAGTRSEIDLAIRYRRPLIAYLRRSDEIPGLPPEVEWTSSLERIRGFVESKLTP
ncbi:MAG: molybdenum cofactor carrier protein [Acidobacteriota bacterium]|nr:MAG: molybdenum cofactor carrier protein [Acidobacteriota bacterium]